MNIEKFLRAAEVQRWHTVHSTKYQSVAEHQWCVWVIASAIYDVLFPTPHNSDDEHLCATMALTHDLPEVFTGDMPSHGKELMNEAEKVVLQAYETRVSRVQVGQDYTAHRGTLPEAVVKLADRLEAAHFARRYVTTPGVRASTTLGMMTQLFECKDKWPDQRWPEVQALIVNVLLPSPDPED